MQPKYLVKYLSPVAVEKYGEISRNYSFLVNLTNDKNQVIGLDSFAKNVQPRNKYYDLKEVMRLTNIAIVQQNLLSGDYMLPLFVNLSYKKLNRSLDSASFVQMTYFLHQNELLARNYVNVFIKNYMDSSKQSLAQYGYAFNSKSPVVMKQVLQLPYEIKYYVEKDSLLMKQKVKKAAGWYANISGQLVPLPAPSDLVDLKIEHTVYMQELLNSRNYLLGVLNAYDLHRNLSIDISKALNYFILKH